jgi:hypothetical protein
MNLVNDTKLTAACTVGIEKSGREWLVVAAKATFDMPAAPDDEPRLSAKQAPLTTADEFSGEPGLSAPRYECDFALRKPRCDVLLNGSAYAPGGSPAKRVTVSLEAASMKKSFDVAGHRVYRAGVFSVSASEPEPFTVMPISYDNAFGGVDRLHKDPARHRWHPLNHAGVGYHPDAPADLLDGRPLANTEETGRPAIHAGGDFRPMSFGPVARAWQPRVKHAGTYGQKWLDEKFPFLPDDFDDRYFQAAPEDQQIEFPRGGERIQLTNLTPQGRTAFRLPLRLGLPVLFVRREGEIAEAMAVVDTIIIEPDENRFMLVWRTSTPLQRNLREISQTIVGKSAEQWRRAEQIRRRKAGKRRFASLAEVVESRRR